MSGHWVGHVRLPNIALIAEEACGPPAERPLVICSGGVIRDVSVAGAEAGIRSGMSIAAARQICPDAVVRTLRPEQYRKISELAWEAAREHCSRIEPLEFDEAFVAIGPCSVTDAADRAWRLIADIARRPGLSSMVGLADNRLLARILSGPAGACLRDRAGVAMAPDNIEQWLARLNIGQLWPVSGRLREQLSRLGFETIGSLAAVGEVELERMFGPAGRELARYCRGVDTGRVAVGYPAEISDRITFVGGVADQSVVTAALSQSADRLATSLEEKMQGCRLIMLELQWPGGSWAGSRRWDVPCADVRAIEHALRHLFAMSMTEGGLGGRLTAVTSAVRELAPSTWRQPGLFDDNRPSGQRRPALPQSVGLAVESRRERMLALFDPARGAWTG